MTQYIPITKEITTTELTKLFVLYVVKDFSTLVSIILNRDFVFTSKFWATLCFYLKIRRQLSIVFYLQTNK